MHSSLVQFSKSADWERFPDSRKPQNRVQSEALQSRNADHIFHLLPAAGVLDLALLENSLRGLPLISSNILRHKSAILATRSRPGLAEAIGPVGISRRRRGAFHDNNRAITLRCPPRVVDGMKWPSSQFSLLLSCNMRTTIVDHGPVGHILDL